MFIVEVLTKVNAWVLSNLVCEVVRMWKNVRLNFDTNKYILWWNYIMATNVNFFSHCKIHFVLKYYFIVWKKFKLYGMHVYLQESEREILCDFVHPCLCVWFCLYMRAYVSVIFHAVLYGKEINHGW